MSTERAQDLHAFKRFVDQQLADDPVPTVGEVIARWDAVNQPDSQQADAVDAVKASLLEIELGESARPAREVVAKDQSCRSADTGSSRAARHAG